MAPPNTAPALYVYQQRKCPLGHADYCVGSQCAIFDDADGCCAILAIARALNVKSAAPAAKKGGK